MSVRMDRSTFLFNCGLTTKTRLRRLGLQIIDHQTTNNPGIEHKLRVCFPLSGNLVELHNFLDSAAIAVILKQP